MTNNKARLAKLETLPSPPSPCPVGWVVRGPRLFNWWIEDYKAWPGYIAGLMRAGLLTWKVHHGYDPKWDGKYFCEVGEVEGFNHEYTAAMETVNSVFVFSMPESEQAKLPRDVAGMIELLETANIEWLDPPARVG